MRILSASIVILSVFILLFGCTGTINNDKPLNVNKSTMVPDKNVTPSASNNSTGNPSVIQNQTTQNQTPSSQPSGVSYAPFQKSAYDQARASGKIIFLEFYANWCPVCAAEEPELNAAFSQVKNPNFVAFRVNYKDSDTDSDEAQLARDFGITYQHTHVILDSKGSVVTKSLDFWSKAQVLSELTKAGVSIG
ncbi:TlpA family protein disulfide reductase [Candidatus Micrarchaeota archaeon]|nr:TlpA family protein disulfide reductase [Candidatus Micrarchaeota archaeon]